MIVQHVQSHVILMCLHLFVHTNTGNDIFRYLSTTRGILECINHISCMHMYTHDTMCLVYVVLPVFQF